MWQDRRYANSELFIKIQDSILEMQSMWNYYKGKD